MSTHSKAQKPKKFRGFTDIFKKANVQEAALKDALKKDEAKKPFAGFTDAYKNFHLQEPEYEDDIDSYESYVLRPRKEVTEIQPTEPIKHFVPTRYSRWRAEKVEAAEDRLGISQGSQADEKQSGESIRQDTTKSSKSFLSQNQKYTRRKQSQFDLYPYQAALYFNEHPPIRPPSGNDQRIFQDKPSVPDSFSNLNEYPQKYHMRMLNNRLRKFLRTYDDGSSRFLTETRSDYSEDYPNDFKSFTAHKNELIEYFNKNVESSRDKKIDFERENFREWYSKISFKLDKKYKNIPKFELHDEDDFQSWYEQISEKLDRNCHVTRGTMAQTLSLDDQDWENARVTEGSNSGCSIAEKNPSISRCNTCRSI